MILAMIISIRMIISISMSSRSISSISTMNTVIAIVACRELANQLGHRAGTRQGSGFRLGGLGKQKP